MPDFSKIFDALSSDRLGKYKQYKTTKFNDQETVQRYLFNSELSAEVHKAVHILEVVLRNQVTKEWNKYLGTSDWPLNGSHIPNLGKFQLMHRKLSEAISRAGSTPTNGKVVAELSLGFWLHMFDNKFDVHNIKIIKNIFLHRKSWNKSLRIEIGTIRDEIEVIHELRNRIAHHEPIFHRKDLDAQFKLITDHIEQLEPACMDLLQGNNFKNYRKSGWQAIKLT